jgi:hypothetical protein
MFGADDGQEVVKLEVDVLRVEALPKGISESNPEPLQRGPFFVCQFQ